MALQKVGVNLLEPMLHFKLEIPQEVNARAIADISKMRGTIDNVSSNGDWTKIEGIVPLDSSKEYSAEVSSYTQGLGVLTTKSAGYQIANQEIFNTGNIDKKDKLLFMFEKVNE